MATGRDLQRESWPEVAQKFVAPRAPRSMVEGQLSTRKWTDQSGQERYTTEVVNLPALRRRRSTMLDGRGGGG